MNVLPVARRAAIIRSLTRGNSIRATARRIGVAKATVLKLLVEVGDFCSVYQDLVLRDLACARVEVDEIWSFVGANQIHAASDGKGDLWTYVATCSDSKLILCWLVGFRDHQNTFDFMKDVALRLANRAQPATDGLSWYVEAIEGAGRRNDVDFAELTRTYGNRLDETEPQRRFSPSAFSGATKTVVMNEPDTVLASAYYVERQDRNMGVPVRGITRLANGFSKRALNHAQAVGLYFMFYNFCLPHQMLTQAAGGRKTTPAMAAGVADRVWTVEEFVERHDRGRRLQGS
ncbi:MAG: IS1 family transposase [Gemmatimonadaceae bacterium]|nr:IS1 family transposase [Gemmatimonadaceae bacterium]